MKKFFLFALIIPLLFSCGTEETITKLSGSATNIEEGYFIINSRGVKDTVFLAEDNSFEFIVNIDKETPYIISFEREYLSIRIEPDQNVIINFDKADFINSVSFDGDYLDVNNYLLAKNKNDKVIQPTPDEYKLPYSEYKAFVDNNMKAGLELLNECEKDNENAKFWVIEEADILYGWASNLEMYPAIHKYYAKVDNVELPEDFDSYKEKLDINNSAVLNSPSFIAWVRSEVRKAVSEAKEGIEDADITMLNMKISDEVISSKEVLDFYRVDYVKGLLSYKDLGELDNAIAFIRENVSDTELMADFEKEYTDWLTLAAGQPGLDFSGVDLDGNTIHFSDFKGKYVYVDVWATWCGPCRSEIPFLKKLEEDYHGRNIIFMSYSIDDDKQAWLDFVPENELGGVQIFGEAAWDSELTKYYKIRGIPRFMLFGPEGEIVSVNMSRPSNDATREKFDSFTDL